MRTSKYFLPLAIFPLFVGLSAGCSDTNLFGLDQPLLGIGRPSPDEHPFDGIWRTVHTVQGNVIETCYEVSESRVVGASAWCTGDFLPREGAVPIVQSGNSVIIDMGKYQDASVRWVMSFVGEILEDGTIDGWTSLTTTFFDKDPPETITVTTPCIFTRF